MRQTQNMAKLVDDGTSIDGHILVRPSVVDRFLEAVDDEALSDEATVICSTSCTSTGGVVSTTTVACVTSQRYVEGDRDDVVRG